MFSQLTNAVRPRLCGERAVALLRAAAIDMLHQLSSTDLVFKQEISAEPEHRPEFCITDPFYVSVGQKQRIIL